MAVPVQKAERRLFVYGSLLPGERDHGLLAEASKLGAAETAPAYALVELPLFPALIGGGSIAVQGELYALPTQVLAKIDILKEHPVLFKRRAVRLADGSEADAYFMDLDQVRGRRRLACAAWRDRFTPRAKDPLLRPRWHSGKGSPKR